MPLLVCELRSLVWLCRWHNGRKERLEELYREHFAVFAGIALQEMEGIPTGGVKLDLAGFNFSLSCDGESMTILSVDPPETISGRQLALFAEMLEDDEVIEELVLGEETLLSEEELQEKLHRRKEVMVMADKVEKSLRLAILYSPQEYGLTMEDVNPLLVLLVEGDKTTPEEALGRCAKKVSRKAEEVFGMVEAFLAFRKEHPESVDEVPDSEKTEGESQEGPISHRQIRFLGYLHRQLGEEPNYESIRKLTRAEATKEISRLEGQVKETKGEPIQEKPATKGRSKTKRS